MPPPSPSVATRRHATSVESAVFPARLETRHDAPAAAARYSDALRSDAAAASDRALLVTVDGAR
ncbi:MAG TPA: hypothetical protein VFU81_06040, partial [Thermomicrobiales bacterium]|nr:hypothetical protein [Thermomicrobiales bacterium]